ncbi:MAG: right-handed parallel beta-helix repeat-containing protein, partial [Promethearchaeota archaeon]
MAIRISFSRNIMKIIFLTIFFGTLINAPFVSLTQKYVNSRSSAPILALSANHSPILIDGNTDFMTQASNENWSGDGTFSNPYVIDGLIIRGSTTNIQVSISNTDIHFRIKNCVLSGGETGVRFENVHNAQIINSIIYNNVIDGISFLGNSKNILLVNNSVNDNYWDGIYITDECENFTVLNNTITGNRYGINTRGVNLTITENYLANNLHSGISLSGSLNQLFDNKVIDNGVGIRLGGSNNTVINNMVKNNDEEGIRLTGAFNTVANNLITNNSMDGIGLLVSENNTIVNNILENNEFRIQAIDWDGLTGTTDPRFEDYLQKEVWNNSINGRKLIYWQNKIGETVPNESWQVILVNCSSITIENQILSGGIDVVHSSHLWISNNTIPSRIGPGIRILSSNSCSLIGNTIMNVTGGAVLSRYGMRIVASMNCTVASNIIINTEGCGVYLQNSWNNTLQDNKVTNNSRGGITITSYWQLGVYFYPSINNRLIDNILIKNGLQVFPYLGFLQNEMTNNTINGKPLLFWQNKTGATVPDGVGQVILFNCPSTRILGQVLAGILALNSPSLFIHNNVISNGGGIFLNATDNSILSENTIVNNYGSGIGLEFSENCTLMNNTVSNNLGVGIDLFICTNCI